jgi:hypothetical protein
MCNQENMDSNPVLNDAEFAELDDLTARYEKLITPGPLARTAKKVVDAVPEQVKDSAKKIGESITEQELYEKALTLINSGFKAIESQAARLSISEASIIKNVNAISSDDDIARLDEICTLRSYDVAKASNKVNTQHTFLAFAEGAGTGAAGFAGIPFNLVLSTFMYFRAVQSIAMSYGFDVKNDPAELVIASEVFTNALSPSSKGEDGATGTVVKIMAIGTADGVKQTAKKTWVAMIERGGVARLLAQMRALANKAAQKALINAGQKGLENSVFKEVFEQIGRRLTLKAIQRAVPVVSAGIGAFVDTAQMNTVMQYAEIFYHKRFILEKETRVNRLLGISEVKDTARVDVITDEKIAEWEAVLENDEWPEGWENSGDVLEGKLPDEDSTNESPC